MKEIKIGKKYTFKCLNFFSRNINWNTSKLIDFVSGFFGVLGKAWHGNDLDIALINFLRL